ncbi:MAG: universal stress protein [Myxococcales bacterium]|nr:universal stress protein [Myxococcales bacterium]
MSEILPTTVVVGIDYSNSSERALEMAWDLAAAAPAAELHIIHVVEKGLAAAADGSRVDEEEERLNAFALAHARRALADSPPVRRMVTHVWRGAPAKEIATLAAELDARIIVVGTHGRHGLSDLLLGSVAERLVRIAPCATLVVPPLERRQAAEALRIEPPCPQCVVARRQSEGREFWCQRHAAYQGRRHTAHVPDVKQTHTANSLLISSWGFGAAAQR